MKRRIRQAVREDVQKVKLSARTLVTIGITHWLWEWAMDWHSVAPRERESIDARNAIIRLQPPATANDQQIAAVKKYLLEMGAAIVRVDSRAQAAVLATKQLEKKPERAGARQVCMQMAETSSRKDELQALLDAELLKVGL